MIVIVLGPGEVDLTPVADESDSLLPIDSLRSFLCSYTIEANSEAAMNC